MQYRRASLAAPAVAAAFLAGCASPPDRMEILVATTPPGASCVLSRKGQPIATAAPTPAIALVDPSEAEITIRCRRDGFADAVATVTPHPTAPVFGPLLAPAAPPYEQHVDIALVPR